MATFPSKGDMDQFRTMVRKVLAYRPPEKKDSTPQAKHRQSSKQIVKRQTTKTPVR